MDLCEMCFDTYGTHHTDAWDGLESCVCDDCLAPPVGHPGWVSLCLDLYGAWLRDSILRPKLEQYQGIPLEAYRFDREAFLADVRRAQGDWRFYPLVVTARGQALGVQQVPRGVEIWRHARQARGGRPWRGDVRQWVVEEDVCATVLPADVCTCGAYRLVREEAR